MPSEEQHLTERQRHWLEQLRACEASGQRMVDYAADQGIDVNALYTWKKALVKKGVLPRTRPVRFQQAQIMDPPVRDSAWQIRLANGRVVCFSGAVDGAVLSSVLSAAERPE